MEQVCWSIEVSADTDQSLRVFLASYGGDHSGDLARFVEEAVRVRLLELTAEQAKASNANVSERDLAAAVDEAVQWARRR
ncbi:methionine repressor-like protein [Pseudoduganella sp. LjRoot289]|uniref:ribbon-helix-helix domain-containing protein n=1 Tax=Pseudoduganella sp. LjRoot289 TaxID=3342314 RepID=UPI003ECF1773